MHKKRYPWYTGILLLLVLTASSASSQTPGLSGNIRSGNRAVAAATVKLLPVHVSTITDSLGFYAFKELAPGTYSIIVSAIGFSTVRKQLVLEPAVNESFDVELAPASVSLDEVVVTGTLKAVKRTDSPVPVEVYTPVFLKKNPTPTIFDALQQVNGVRPQLNCNVCNTGDIHINGLEGPYTMVLVDGMPVVSSLSAVYGLSGIPNALVERIEIVKGPASSLYGSEAVGGLINIITKKPATATALSADIMATSWQEINTDIGFSIKPAKQLNILTGISYFNYTKPIDNNGDDFTDITLQNRVAFFQKWNLQRKNNRVFNMAARYYYEDRWGGDMRWKKAFRGSDSIYGENIYTNRKEWMGNYQLPAAEKLMLSFSYTDHHQDSRYGTTSYIARQQIGFTQLTWDKKRGRNDLLAGVALRYTFYDDNTPATSGSAGKNGAEQSWLPGIFLQDEITLAEKHQLLLGFRYDYNSNHGNIYTPRLAYQWKLNDKNRLRLNAGTGFRIVNLFTEDHAALTGARSVVIKNELKPEKTYNINLNYGKKIVVNTGFIGMDITAWYTYFSNRIQADYDTDPDKIIYDNLLGFAESKGVSVNLDMAFTNGIKALAGATFQDVSTTQNGEKQRPVLTEKVMATWSISYTIKPFHLSVDYTGNLYGPMRLPLLGSLDPRKPYSPVWSLQNIQLVYGGFKQVELYGGVKNILNWTPGRDNAFIIARTNDPFDKKVQYTADGKVQATADNPYALTFDPNYVYAPNQGRRGFLGIRITVK
jgi:outer membrane receptor for ferrienterochelin and colicins